MWQYKLADLFDDDDPEEWAQQLHNEGWEYAVRRTGVLVTVGGVVRRRYYLRRWVERQGRTSRGDRWEPGDSSPREHPGEGSKRDHLL